MPRDAPENQHDHKIPNRQGFFQEESRQPASEGRPGTQEIISASFLRMAGKGISMIISAGCGAPLSRQRWKNFCESANFKDLPDLGKGMKGDGSSCLRIERGEQHLILHLHTRSLKIKENRSGGSAIF
jgi:hypothetical protein